ncbi:hypothetical protein EV360DRAFT_54844 [Lentinula raphanica]|nr:hypothetical protein EV360DRAFT_54844 [Lentinula raphanica]
MLVIAASVLAVLKDFGYDMDKINGNTKVLSLFNVMTMELNMHDWFDHLKLYFETMVCYGFMIWDSMDCYHVMSMNAHIMTTFSTPGPMNLPIPNSKLLALHAACAKVAHLLSAGKYIEKIDNNEETIGVLASNGGSSKILTHAILQLYIRAGA